jgi:hypothetical protein
LDELITTNLYLDCISTDSSLLLSKIKHLAVYEFLFDFKLNNNLSMVGVMAKLPDFGIQLPVSISSEELIGMSTANIARATANIQKARQRLIAALSEANMTHPKPDQLLVDWQRDCLEYNCGRNLEGSNFEDNKSRNGNCSLTLMAAFILRHIMYDLDVPLWKMPALWATFYFLIMHKPIETSNIASQQSIWSHVTRVDQIDNELQTRRFQHNIIIRTLNGFRRLWYSTSDASKHHGRDHVMFNMTANRSADPLTTDPSFRLLTSSVSAIKTSEFCASKHVNLAVEKLGLECVGYYGGGTNDTLVSERPHILVKVKYHLSSRLRSCWRDPFVAPKISPL